MKFLKKVAFIFLLLLAFSFYNCSSILDDCNCKKATDTPVEIVDIIDAQHRGKSFYGIENNSIPKNEYYGFDVNFTARQVAYQPTINKNKNQFSLFSSAYACTCESSTVYLKNIYPSKVKIKTLFALNDTIPAGNLINRHIRSNFSYLDVDRILVDSLSITTVRSERSSIFDLSFNFPNLNVIQNDSIQFEIEIELNNGKIVNTKTPLLLLK